MASRFPEKKHLGDGAYAQFDGYNVILTTSNGIRATNEVYLDPWARQSFDLWCRELDAAIAAYHASDKEEEVEDGAL